MNKPITIKHLSWLIFALVLLACSGQMQVMDLYAKLGGITNAQRFVYWDDVNGELRVGDSADIYNLNAGGDNILGLTSEGRNNKLRLTSYDATHTNWIACNKARGSRASPTAVQAGDTFCSFVGVGNYGGSDWAHGAEYMQKASGNWSGSSFPAGHRWLSVIPGETTQTPNMQLAMNGSLDLELQVGNLQVQNGAFQLAVRTTCPPVSWGSTIISMCGTNSGTAALAMCGGASSSPVKIIDNIGSGVTGC